MSQSKLRKNVGILLNVAIVGFVLALVVLFTKTYFFTPNKLKVGDRISVQELRLKSGERAVILFLQSDCLICSKGAGYYQSILTGLEQSPNVRLIALFPLTEIRAEEYVAELGLPGIEFYKIGLNKLGITGTPTIALVDDVGVVQELWKGRLSRKEEIEIKVKLNIPTENWYVDENEVVPLSNSGRSVTVVDLRDRETFAKNHFDQAKNLPGDELPFRAQDELLPENNIVVYGLSEADGEKARDILTQKGYRYVYVLRYVSQYIDLKDYPQVKTNDN